MLCRTVRKKLKAYSDGEVQGSAQRRIQDHLKSCAGCAAEADRLAAVWEALGALDDTGDCPDMTGRVLRRIGEYEQRRGRPWLPLVFPRLQLTFARAAICAMVLGFCTGFLGGRMYPVAGDTATVPEESPEGEQYLDVFSEQPSGFPGSVFALPDEDDGEE